MEEMVRNCLELTMLYADDEADNFARLYVNTDTYPCPIFVMRSSVGFTSTLITDVMASVVGDKMNVLVWRKDDVLYTVFIPRSKHRPNCYFAAESEAIHISPGALDMAGVMVATDKDSFSRLSIQTVEGIIREVGISHQAAIDLCQELIRRFEKEKTGEGILAMNDLSVVTFPL
jgi:hypothetical protein